MLGKPRGTGTSLAGTSLTEEAALPIVAFSFRAGHA